MRQALEIVGFVAAALIVLATLLSAIRAVVLPRAAQTLVPALTVKAVRSALRLRSRRIDRFEDRDRIMAMLAPVALVAMLVSWLVIIFAAYALMFFCLGGRSVARAVSVSGSSIVTLGTTGAGGFWPAMISYSEAGVGLLLVALFISYFPSIYSAFTRRETGVTLLQVRAGSPPQPTTMLIRYHRIEGRLHQLTELWRTWEAWFADIEESHTTFPILVHFRSPQPDRSWITAAGVLLDSAAFWLAGVDHVIDPDAQLCLRAGFLALRRIADGFGIAYDPDPPPDGPVSVTREEWDRAMAQLEEAGVPLVADRDRAWRDWRGWRVNYDTVLLGLARVTEAPPVPWVSDRSPVWGRGPGRRANGWLSARPR
ncbi:MAG TPA: hypothetical protein VFH58_06140 [Acidimicrobiales bacterium]|nr:hypothetical protein [Acidimicrobiales bacterium]